ncbi:TPA: hypothetical protein ACH3X1_016715 [Trebouxia sp. C0004]
MGLRQGCPLSATLFGLFIDGLHHYLETMAPAAGVRIQHLRLRELVYADDMCLMASSPEHLQALIDALSSYCAILHMEISVLKTKVMVVSPVPAPAVAFSCNDNPIEQVTSFKYLGLHFHQSGAVAHLVTPIRSKAGGSWAAVQRRHSLLQGGTCIYIYCRLSWCLSCCMAVKCGVCTARVLLLLTVLVGTCNVCMITTSGQSVVCCLQPRVGCCWQS